MRRLSQVRSAADGLLLVQAFLFASLVPVLMRLPLGRVRAILEPRRPPRFGCDAEGEGHVLGLVNLALDLARIVSRPGCLSRGLTRYYFLRRAGVDLELAFGLGRPVGDEAAGHCWLTRQGEPFLEARDPRPLFTELYRIGGRC